MNKLIFFKGILVGIAKIIPGFSGSLLMVSFGLYDKAIYSITHFFDDVKNNFSFLFKFCFGVLIGIVLFSKIIIYFLNKYYLYTIMFFVGLIIGGLPNLFKNVLKDKLSGFLTFFSFIFFSFLSFSFVDYSYQVSGTIVDYFVFFFSGFLEAIGTIIPGVSSTVLLMLVGVYSYYINCISHILSISFWLHNISFFIPFSMGLLIGIIAVSSVMDYLFRNYRRRILAIILGCVSSSIVLLFIKVIPFFSGFVSLLISIIIIVVGYIISSFLK